MLSTIYWLLVADLNPILLYVLISLNNLSFTRIMNFYLKKNKKKKTSVNKLHTLSVKFTLKVYSDAGVGNVV